MVRTLDVVVTPRTLTTRQFLDLELIDHREDRARVEVDKNGAATISAGEIWSIPPAAARLLLDRGWLSRTPHANDVWISAAGRMAPAWHWHREQNLPARLLKGLYLDAALTAADTAHRRLEHHARPRPA
ncbi:hypothetical protein ACIRL2_45745 [Embleya sp. NPDC127516]|uniref:hypothetical protein n=1 Tax=Embleya sp. NPDC127516 TaxID=3363990 RepID=UPI0038056B2B